MTSEPDSIPRRRPPTIDLTATEIETENPAPGGGGTEPAGERSDGAAAPEPRTGWNRASRLLPHAIGAVAGGLVMAAILFGLWIAGLVPTQNATPAAATSGTANISAQLEKIQAQLQTMPAEQAFAARVATVEAQTKTLSDSLAAINRRLDDIAVAAQSAREHADAASAAAKGATENFVQRGDLEPLAARIAALESAVKALADATAHRTAGVNDRAARAAVAAEALRAVVERGAPFQGELAAVKSFAPEPNAVAALEPFAATGVPSALDLARELSELTPSLLKASGTAPSDGSFLGRLENNAKNLVRITPVGIPAGDDPLSVVARLNADAARADLAAALADIARLPPTAKTLAEPWVQRASARDKAIAASRRIAADALAALGNAETQ
jgi:hypothetical protein